MSTLKAEGFGIGATSTFYHPFSLAIALVQGGWPSHIVVMFWMSDGTIQYYQALFNDGFVGPFMMNGLMAKQAKLRVLKLLPLFKVHYRMIPCTEAEAEAKRQYSIELCEKTRGYAKSQILAKFGHERFGWAMQSDPNYIDCSEGGAMVLAYKTPEWDILEDGHATYDGITPKELLMYANKRLAEEQRKAGIHGHDDGK